MKGKVWIKFSSYLLPYLKYQIVLLFLLLFGTVCSIASPYILKIIVDDVFPNSNYLLLYQLLCVLFGIYVLRIVCYFFTDYLNTWLSNNIFVDISADLFAHVLKLPLSFFNNQDIGEIVHRLNNEIGSIQNALTTTLVSFISNAFTIFVLVIAMCYLNFKLFIVISAFYPVLYLILNYYNPKLKSIIELIRKNESDLLGSYTDKLTNIRLIKRFYTYSFESSELLHKLKSLARLYQKEIILGSSSRNWSLLILSIIPLVILGWGGNSVLKGLMSVGSLIAFMQYASRLHGPFQNLVNLYISLMGISVSIHRLYEYFEAEVLIDKMSLDVRKLMPIDTISFENVSYEFENSVVIDDFSFEFRKGLVYALVGSSGSGKTTVINLLSRLLSPLDGVIKVNKRDLNNIPLGHWLGKLCVCEQKSELFNCSLRYNVTYGLDECYESELNNLISKLELGAAKADAKDVLNKSVGLNGSNLSGGQNQKVGLIRMLLAQREVVIIDEATAAIDSIGENFIFDKIKDNQNLRILIIATHRLSTLKKADIIICLDKGRLVEYGSYHKLVANAGYFYNLYRDQFIRHNM